MNIKRLVAVTSSILFGLIIVSIWFSFLTGPPVSAHPNENTFTVCPAGPPTCDFSVIQYAVDKASDGDVINPPAPRPLDLFALTINEASEILVDTGTTIERDHPSSDHIVYAGGN